MTCNNCTWFVEEDKSGEYSHELAIKNKKGFCLTKDLFTMVDFDKDVCSDFNFDGENNAEIQSKKRSN